MSDKETILEYNGETGEEIIRDLTADELKDLETLRAELAAEQAKQDEAIAARKSALAKLAKLGLTAKEIAAL